MKRIDKLRNYLEWLITPQDDSEASKFRELGLVDEYISLKSRINTMSESDLVSEINVQLKGYGLEIDCLPD